MKKTLFILASAFVINVNAQIIGTVAGNGTNGFTGDAGQATVAELYNPSGIILDSFGNLYIADVNNNRIRKVNTAGVITTIAGNGTQGFSGNGGQATDAELKLYQNTLDGIGIDMMGNLYIADGGNHCIRMVNTFGIINTVAGTGIGGYSGDGGQATAANLYFPSGVTFDASNNMYIVDGGHNHIRMVNSLGIITTKAGINSGTSGFSGDGGQASSAEFDYPSGIAFDALGNLYIADVNNNRIRKVNTSGIITTVVGNGTQGFSGDGGQASVAELNNPFAVSFDAIGNLYIADYRNNRIRKVNTLGVISTVVGNGTGGFNGDGNQAIATELDGPSGIAFDGFGNMYIADEFNYRVRKVINGAAGIFQISGLYSNISIYPNPNNGNFILETNANTKQTMQVYDVNGKLVLSQIIQPTPNPSKEGNSTTTIDASSLMDGIYNISIITNEGLINKRVVIVR